MKEANLDIEIKEVGDRTFHNVDLKRLGSVSEEEFIIVEKDKYVAPYVKDMGTFIMHTFSVKYKNKSCTFVSFDEKLAEEWENLGGLGDNVKIIAKKEAYVDKKGIDRIKQSVRFEKAQVI